MSEIQPQASNRTTARGARLWIVAAVVIVVAIGLALVITKRARQSATIDSQFQRLDRLGTALEAYAKAHDASFPEETNKILTPADVATIMTDAQSGEQLIYRVTTASGESIRYDFMGDRIIAWTPQASYRGSRALLLNNCDVKFAPDEMLDLPGQRFLGSDRLNQMVPKLSTADPDDESDSADEPEEPSTRGGG